MWAAATIAEHCVSGLVGLTVAYYVAQPLLAPVFSGWCTRVDQHSVGRFDGHFLQCCYDVRLASWGEVLLCECRDCVCPAAVDVRAG